MQYSLFDYFDVWGNGEDGYWVNDQRVKYNDLNISEDSSGIDIISFLFNLGYFNTNDYDKFYVECSTEWIEIFDSKDMYPLCSLRPGCYEIY